MELLLIGIAIVVWLVFSSEKADSTSRFVLTDAQKSRAIEYLQTRSLDFNDPDTKGNFLSPKGRENIKYVLLFIWVYNPNHRTVPWFKKYHERYGYLILDNKQAAAIIAELRNECMEIAGAPEADIFPKIVFPEVNSVSN